VSSPARFWRTVQHWGGLIALVCAIVGPVATYVIAANVQAVRIESIEKTQEKHADELDEQRRTLHVLQVEIVQRLAAIEAALKTRN
jgi:hypothetical protein